MAGPICASLLDRLNDDPGPPGVSLEEFIQSVVRDLNDLVNTPRPDSSELPPHMKELRTSVLTYGLPRPGLLGKSAQDRERVRAALKDAILRFEPRLVAVNVLDARGAEEETPDDASLLPYGFRITGVLRSEPLPTEIVLGATMARYPEAIQVLPGPPPAGKGGDAR